MTKEMAGLVGVESLVCQTIGTPEMSSTRDKNAT